MICKFLQIKNQNTNNTPYTKAVRNNLLKLKNENPSMRFRLESNRCTKEALCTATVGESGLEAPEEFFVELDIYRLKYPDPSPEEIVFEEIDGVQKAGVS